LTGMSQVMIGGFILPKWLSGPPQNPIRSSGR
jgi:hypothetical protein